jgi:transaldolase
MYPDTKYVDALIGPETVNTLPPQTLKGLRDHGTAARTIDLDTEEAYAVVERLATAGVDMTKVTDQLLTDGVRLFAESFEKMIADIEAKRARFAR